MTRADGTRNTPSDGGRNPWWDWRRKRVWLIIAILVYTLVGFFVIPAVARSQIVAQLQSRLGLAVALERLHFNPWTQRAEAEGFEIRGADGERMIAFKQLVVDLQASSLLRRAWTFDEIAVVQPFAHFTRHADGTLNLDPLLALADSEPQAEPDDTQPGLVRLLVGRFAIEDGRVEVRDDTLKTPFTASVGPIDIAVTQLTTLAERSGEHHVTVLTERGTRLDWSGALALNPLASAGHVTASGPYLPLVYQYFQDQLNFEVTGSTGELSFDYRIAAASGADFEAGLSKLDFTLRGAQLRFDRGDRDPEQFVELPELRIKNAAMAWPARTVSVEALEIDDPAIAVWQSAAGDLNLEHLLVETPGAQPAEQTQESEPEAAAQPWDLRLATLKIDNLMASYSDRQLDGNNTVTANPVDLTVTDITNQDGGVSPFELSLAIEGGGDVRLAGELTALPAPRMKAALTVTGLALGVAQPWVTAAVPVAIDSGALALTAALQIHPDETFGATGALTVSDLDVRDATRDERLVGWQALDADRFEFSASQRTLDISQLKLAGPYVRVRIEKDQTTNFESLLAAAPEPGAAGAAVNTKPDTTGDDDSRADTAGPPFDVSVGAIEIADGGADYSDLSLPLPFAAKITGFDGKVTTLGTQSAEPTTLLLTGAVGEYGLVEVDGRVLASDPKALTDIGVQFTNVEMPTLSPYTAKFAGREIAGGRIDLDLNYTIEQSELKGTNNIVMRELELGDKVDSPDAANLPLGLAVALLKGPDGTIDLDLPVSGNVDDPEFSVGAVVLKTFANLITRIATSPFRLLGNLVGVESDDFGTIEFRAGDAQLMPPERETIAKLAEALSMRPQLALVVRGVSAAGADTEPLKRARIDAAIESGLAAEEGAGEDAMLIERRRGVVESLLTARDSTIDLAAVAAAHQRPKDPDKPDGRQVLDVPAYVADLEQRLVATESVTQADLAQLAAARAQAVHDALAAAGTDSSSLTIGEPEATSANDAGRVPMKLDVSTGGRADTPE